MHEGWAPGAVLMAVFEPVDAEVAGALIETQGDIPLANIRSGTVAVSLDALEGKAVITFAAVVVMPRIQYDAVLRTVAAEREAREADS